MKVWHEFENIPWVLRPVFRKRISKDLKWWSSFELLIYFGGFDNICWLQLGLSRLWKDLYRDIFPLDGESQWSALFPEDWGQHVWPRWVFLVIDSCSDFVGPLLTPLRCRQQKFPKDTHPEATKDLFIIILSMKAFDFSTKKVGMSKNFMRDFWIIGGCLSFIRISWMWKYRLPDVSWLKEDSYKVYCRGWSDLLF